MFKKYLTDSKNWMKKIVSRRLEEFGTADNAPKLKPIPLISIAKQYKSGELSPKIN